MDTGFGYVLDPRLVLAVSELRVRRHRESPPRSGGGRASEEWIGDLKVAALVAVTLTLVAGSAFKDSGAVSHQRLSRDKAAPEHHRCPDARSAVPYYRFYTHLWQTARGVRLASGMMIRGHTCGYARFAAKEWRARAQAARQKYKTWISDEWNWEAWLPDKWYRIARCETGVNWQHNSGTYQGAFGFYTGTWDAFKPSGAPSEAYLASPREQYQAALNVYARYGYDAWGCRAA